MKGLKTGFTLVEVSLFLAVTALLLLGVTMGVRGSVFQQRFNDSVQNFAEFLRSAYSETINVEHTGTGNSEYAVYGKLLTFGETYDFVGNKLDREDNRAFSYTIIGKIGDFGTQNVLKNLIDLRANVVIGKSESSYELAGIAQEYIPRWGAGIQTTKGFSEGTYQPFEGSVLIVRHPGSGTVFTFYSKTVIEVNEALREGKAGDGLLTSEIEKGSFGVSQIDFCVNSSGYMKSMRRDVRIVEGARNASGVEVINQDNEEDNLCEQ